MLILSIAKTKVLSLLFIQNWIFKASYQFINYGCTEFIQLPQNWLHHHHH